jgi:DNA (cytosine-5)-methyltransferase 1
VNILSLFAGIGGFDVGLERAGFRSAAFCEIEPYCQKVLAKNWPGVPIYGDVRELTAARLAADGVVPDVIVGGFPCQDISKVGRRAGIDGEKSGLWREFARLIGEVRPGLVIVENSAELTGRGLGDILGDLARLGYDAEWHRIPATYVGARHRRDRTWIVSYPAGERDGLPPLQIPARRHQLVNVLERPTEPRLGRVADELPDQAHRLRALGNAVDTGIPELLGRAWLRDICDSDGTATAAHCEDNAVPKDCQARAESIAQHGSGG